MLTPPYADMYYWNKSMNIPVGLGVQTLYMDFECTPLLCLWLSLIFFTSEYFYIKKKKNQIFSSCKMLKCFDDSTWTLRLLHTFSSQMRSD